MYLNGSHKPLYPISFPLPAMPKFQMWSRLCCRLFLDTNAFWVLTFVSHASCFSAKQAPVSTMIIVNSFCCPVETVCTAPLRHDGHTGCILIKRRNSVAVESSSSSGEISCTTFGIRISSARGSLSRVAMFRAWNESSLQTSKETIIQFVYDTILRMRWIYGTMSALADINRLWWCMLFFANLLDYKPRIRQLLCT